MRTVRLILFAAIVGLITAAALVIWHKSDSLLAPSNGCTAKVNGYTANLDTNQGQYAALISAVAVQRGLPARAASIALATAYQESKIRNLPGGDLDSLGLFQQRPSQGWGTATQIMDPVYATNAFYNALVKVPNYESLDITVAAQEVQRSAYPTAYAQHANDARALASALTGYSPAAFTCIVTGDTGFGTAADVIAGLQRGYGTGLSTQRGLREDVTVNVGTASGGNVIGWSVAQYAVAMAPNLHIKAVLFDGKKWTTGKDSEKGWTANTSTSASAVSIVME